MKTPISRFVPVTADLIEQIRVWRNKSRIRENMLDDTLIEADQQRRWFDSLGQATDRQYRVFLQDDKPVGMLYFSDIGSSACHWGCYIGEDAVWPGSGLILEIAALDFAFGTLDVATLVAEVFEGNRSPIQMHRTFGYREQETKSASTRSGQAKNLICFSYAKADWLANRDQVLAKLPRQIRAAAEHIHFA
ncbi:UDP-4-amino-4,6-dideoxy-N-acetyl-beta-L-altrosamine N-acetyltransferase [Massilia solisilvae]|uniref:UDP-4-amino-4, 6-dideoxy-N-acetyl-beta-L-altrosamine N-acetyltransferase n=1 Tax=Massilia solisilvae TaxID=1811225 RepID=A0ABT2BEP3_9BURK|nr:UDP-4-amino-4,6-dideoxy-N-acetyl-beta-L-altrosamine N-acetyltransferase [Massilia solisilvae]MCS0606983.1 UDP-4-amino-4,6-dideoxy-N-acetyl-beta-L-altrosamine N-acetyltransferase [Massilia solisilvae]